MRDRHVIAIQAAIGWCIAGLGPVLVLGARDLDIPRYEVSWLGSAFGLGLLGAGLLGRRILRHGAEPVTRVGAVLVTAGVAGLAFGGSLPVLVIGGMLQGAGCAGFLIATPALVGPENRARRLALAVGASSIAGLLAPLSIALVDRGPLTGRAALAVPMLWLVPIALRRLRAADGLGIGRPAAEAPGRSVVSGDTWSRWLVIVLAVSAEFCFWTWGAARLVDAGATDDAASGLAASFAVGMALGRIIGPRKIGSLGPLRLSSIVTAAAAVVVMFDAPVAALSAALFVAGAGIAVLYPVSLARLLDAPGLDEPRLIGLAAYASGVAITVTPVLLGFFDRVVALRWAFGIVPLLVAGVAVLDGRITEGT